MEPDGVEELDVELGADEVEPAEPEQDEMELADDEEPDD